MTQKRGERYVDRDRDETKLLIVDRARKVLRESWTHEPSGEAFVKRVPLSGDDALHGKASTDLFVLKQRRPSSN